MKTTKILLATLLMIFLASCSSDDDETIATTISTTDLDVTVEENSVATNDVLGTVTATSNSTEAISYSITSQTPAGALNINATTGEVTVDDTSLFDYETNATISATISATSAGASTTATVTVNLTDVSDIIFTHVAVASNITGNVTYLDHPDLNNNPDAIIVVNHNWTPNGIYNNKVSGVWYNTANQKWAIYNEDITDIIVNSAYNVLISKDGEAFIHITNDGAFISTIDHPALNNDPDAVFVISNNYGANSVYNDNNLGVIYDSSILKWRVFNEAGTAIPTGASINIIAKSDNATAILHETTSANITLAGVSQSTAIENITGTDAKFVFTHYSENSSEFLDKVFGLYNTVANNNTWAIYTEDTTTMPVGIKFNILIVE